MRFAEVYGILPKKQRVEHIEITLPRKQGEMVKEGDRSTKERKEEGRVWGDYLSLIHI